MARSVTGVTTRPESQSSELLLRGSCLCPSRGTIAHRYGAEALATDLGVRCAGDLVLHSAPGCNRCNQTGFKGGLAVHELLIADDELAAAIQSKASIADVREIAQRGGMTTLLRDGIAKAVAGHTTLKQVLSACAR